MLIILSQKIDTASEYADDAFKTYHYPARYKNQIHEGDTFIYYQGNRFVKEQRYYFGVGTVGSISTDDGTNYYATLIDGQQFSNKVPIYLPDGKYVEQLGFDSIRKSPTPPWQSSVRPLSQKAFDYIISAAGIQNTINSSYVDELKETLKSNIKDFFLHNKPHAIINIKNTASKIIDALKITESSMVHESLTNKTSTNDPEKIQEFINYCRTTHISYSYKLVLLLAISSV